MTVWSVPYIIIRIASSVRAFCCWAPVLEKKVLFLLTVALKLLWREVVLWPWWWWCTSTVHIIRWYCPKMANVGIVSLLGWYSPSFTDELVCSDRTGNIWLIPCDRHFVLSLRSRVHIYVYALRILQCVTSWAMAMVRTTAIKTCGSNSVSRRNNRFLFIDMLNALK